MLPSELFADASPTFSKAVPLTLEYAMDMSIVPRMELLKNEQAVKSLMQNNALSMDQLTVIDKLCHESAFPAGINTPAKISERKMEFYLYKAYYQASWLQTYPAGHAEMLHIIWIPKEGNTGVKADMVPANEMGIFFIVADRAFDNKQLPLKPLVRTPQAITAFTNKLIKKAPVKIDYTAVLRSRYCPEKIELAYRAICPDSTYSAEDYQRFLQLSYIRFWPPAFSDPQTDTDPEMRASVKLYNAYEVGEFKTDSYKVLILWIPKEENIHMPAGMQPLTNEGIFMCQKVEGSNSPEITAMLDANKTYGITLSTERYRTAQRNEEKLAAIQAAAVLAENKPQPKPTKSYTINGIQHSQSAEVFENRYGAGVSASGKKYSGKRVLFAYYQIQKTTLTFSNNDSYQVVLAYITAPEDMPRDEVLSVVPEREFRKAFGMAFVSDSFRKCVNNNCDDITAHLKRTYRNVSTRSAGSYSVN